MLVAGIYSIARYGIELTNVLNLSVGIYLLATSNVVVDKIKEIGGGKNGKKK